jgi:hypothetical protein
MYGAMYVQRREMRESLYDWARPGEVTLGIVVGVLLVSGLFAGAYAVTGTLRSVIFAAIAWIAVSTVCMAYLSTQARVSRSAQDEPGLRERLTPDFATLFGGGGWIRRNGDFGLGGSPYGYYWGYDTNPAWIILYILLIMGLQSIPRMFTTGTWVFVAGFVVLLIVSALLLPILIGWFSWYGYAIGTAPFRTLQVGYTESRFTALEEEVKREFQEIQQMVQSESALRNGNHGAGFRPMTFTDYWVNGEPGVALAGMNMVWLSALQESEELGRWVDCLELIAGIRPSSPDAWVRQVLDLDGRLRDSGSVSPTEDAKRKALRQVLRPLALMKVRWVGRSALSAPALQSLIKFLYESPPETLIQPAFLREMKELGKRLQAIEPTARLTEYALSGAEERGILAKYRQIRDTAERTLLADSLGLLQRYLTGSEDPPTLPTIEEAKNQFTAWADQGPPNLRGLARILLREDWILTERVMHSLLHEPLPRVPLFYRVLGGWLSGARTETSLMNFFLWALAFLERVHEFAGEREVGAGLWGVLRDALMAVSPKESQRRVAEERATLQSLLKPPVSANWAAIPEDLVSIPAAVPAR